MQNQKTQRKLEQHFVQVKAQQQSRTIMFIPFTSFSFAGIFSKQYIRNSKFCTLLEKWGADEGAKKISEGVAPRRTAIEVDCTINQHYKTAIQSRCKKVHCGHSIMLQKCSEANFTLEQNRICSLDKLKSSRIQLLVTF